MATESLHASTGAFPLTLVSYPPERQIAVLRALQKATKGSNELTLKGAKALIEGVLPAVVDYYDTESARNEARKVLEEVGAVVTVEPVAEAQAAISLGEIWGALVEEYGTLKLVYNTCGRHHDARIGEPVTKDMAEDLGAVFSELGRSLKRLDALGDDVDELRAAIHKEVQS
jgi:hypothetical protein